ncbi:hypothetical protein [Thermococcus sp. 2319x1]|nr:hypothetical protein [Thermococcus sp. 2319x1]
MGLIVFSSSMLISMTIPIGKTRYKLLVTVLIFIVGVLFLSLKTPEAELIPGIVALTTMGLWMVYDLDTEDYIVLKTKKGKYLLTSSAPRDKVEKAIKEIMGVLIDD